MKKTIVVIIVLLIAIAGFIFYKTSHVPDLETIKDSVVKIQVYDKNGDKYASGSGFCLYKSNYIVTNYHVIEEGYKFTLIGDDKTEYDVTKIVAANKQHDIAILSGDFSFKPIKLGSSKNLRSGENVTVVGSPEGVLNIASTGIISNANDDYNFNLTAAISPGSSGGVVLNSKYEAIGVVRATHKDDSAQNLNYAIRIKYVDDMYDEIKSSKVIEVNDENYDKLVVSIEKLKRYHRFFKENYYSFSDLSIFYKLTNETELFEYALASQKPDWFARYVNLPSDKRSDIVDDIYALAKRYPANHELTIPSKASDWYTQDFFSAPQLIEDYKYLILREQINATEDKTEQKKIVDSTDIDNEGLKCLILTMVGNYKLTDFSEKQRQEIIKYIESKVEDNTKAKRILEMTGFTVEIKDDKTLDVTLK